MKRDRNHHLVLRGDTWYFVKIINEKKIKRALSKSVSEARELRDELLREILINGDIQRTEGSESEGILFGEISLKWAKITAKRVKKSTMRDYRTSMNANILPRFGNHKIADITYLDIEEFITEFDCSAKRINNILVPLRGVFKLAWKSKFIDQNIMSMVENRKIEKPQIKPLTFEEVNLFLHHVDTFNKPFFEVAFYTGMRGGEMSALKWDNVDFEKRKIRITETRVYGEEGRPKTNSSYRTICMIPLVYKALQDQALKTRFKTPYVFVNGDGNPVDVSTMRKNAWTVGLKRSKIEYRPMIQTRHTFATLMISSGENLGWVQGMLGHSSLKTTVEKYFTYIPNVTHQDGSRFMDLYSDKSSKSTPNQTQEAMITGNKL